MTERTRYEAVFDTKKAQAAAKEWEKRLAQIQRQEKRLGAEQQKRQAEIDRLRQRIIRLSAAKAKASGATGKLNKETQAARAALAAETEAARVLQRQQRALARETAALQKEEERHRRSIEKSTRAIARYQQQEQRAITRSARATERHRATEGRLGRADARVGRATARRDELRDDLRERGSFRGRASLRARESMRSRFSDDNVFGAVGNAGGVARGAIGTAAGLATGVVGAATSVARVGAERETLKAGLSTALGSQAEAEQAFEQIKKFASETPFAVNEVTSAVTKLKVRGLEPTVEAATEALRTYGDVAGALGRDLDSVIDAVSAASIGEFERLKENFNVIGKKAGDEVQLTFGGVTTTVKNNSEEITNYLKNLSKTNFAGGMAKQAATIAGAWSNVGDAVSNFTEEIYLAGVGDALKEVLGDIMGTVGGSEDLAKVFGKQLAQAVRELYNWVKRLLGPTDELPEKLALAFSEGKKFVGFVGSAVEVLGKLASLLLENEQAANAFALALSSSLGPLGVIATAAAIAGASIVKMFDDAKIGLSDLARKSRQIQTEAETKVLEKKLDEERSKTKKMRADEEAAEAKRRKFAEERLREKGVSSFRELSPQEQQKLRDQMFLIKSTDYEGQLDDLVSGATRKADESEFKRLSKIPANKRTPSQQARVQALSKQLDVRLPSSSTGKPELSAFEAEQQSIIEKEAKAAGLRAGDEALLQGRGSEAGALAKQAEQETRKRLKESASRGELLPGEVDTAFARIAGYDQVGSAPPPPVIVNNYKFDVRVDMPIEGTFSGTPDAFVDATAESLRVLLEEQIFPEAFAAQRSRVER